MARGCIGHLRADFGYQGKEFWTTWFDHCAELKTQVFREELDSIINCLRGKGNVLGSLSDLTAYCRMRPDAWFNQQYRNDNYGFRIDTELYSYYLRAMLTQGDYNLYCYCYIRERLEEHLKGAEQ